MIKKILLIQLVILTFSLGVFAQPKWLKKVRKAQLNLVTYDTNGQLLRSTNGFLIDDAGTVVSDYTSFRGAARAVAIDEKGNEYPITAVSGASSLYDVIKLQADIHKGEPLHLAVTNAQKGESVYVAPYLSNKSGVATTTTIEESQLFNDIYGYYTLPLRLNEKSIACPVLNEAGEVIGLVQMSSKADEEKSYAISVAYIRDLSINALSSTASDYRDVLIRKSLPAEASQAASFIYLLGTRDTTSYLSYVADYIRQFPTETNGYTMQAEMLAACGRFKEADETWQEGIEANVSAPELQYSKARTILGAIQASHNVPEEWTLDQALSLAQQALDADSQPIYLALQGHILYAQKRYDEAAVRFVDVCKTPLRSAEHFLYAAQCHQMRNDTIAVLAMQDSAVACFTKPYPTQAAPALLMRATTLRSLNRYREAVMDLNDYEHLMSSSLNANFYYQRYQTEMQCRMFQQALGDIDKCTRLEPQEPLYFAELAATCCRFNQMDEAVIAARRAITLDDSFADAHRILGICLRAQNKEEEARKELQRAIDLGDEIAKTLINK